MTDNAIVVRKGVHDTRLPSFGCFAHVGHLNVKIYGTELNLVVLLEYFNTYFSLIAGLTETAKRTGIKSGKLRSATHKFAFALPPYEHFLQNFDKIRTLIKVNKPRGVDVVLKADEAAAELVAALADRRKRRAAKGNAPPAKKSKIDSSAAGDCGSDPGCGDAGADEQDEAVITRRNRASTYKTLLVELGDNTLHVRIRCFIYISKDAGVLIKESVGDTNCISDYFVRRLKAYKMLLETMHADPEPIIDPAMEESGVKLTDDEYADVQQRLERGIEEAHFCWRHLDEVMPLLEQREAWHPGNEPPSTEAATKEAAGYLWNLDTGAALVEEALRYHAKWKTGCWDASVPPVQPAPLPKGKRRGQTWRPVYVDVIAFFNLPEVVRDFPRVRRVALHYFSILPSTACVERSFSGLRVTESDLRLAITDKSVTRRSRTSTFCAATRTRSRPRWTLRLRRWSRGSRET